MTARVTLPYGTWPSPISAADVARAGLRLGFPIVHGSDVWWQESRPEEGGRTTVVHLAGGERTELLRAPWDARTRVHEHGGRSYLPVRTAEGHALVFANLEDQRLYLLDPGDAEPRPLTPEAAVPGGLRYADFVLSPDLAEIWCVCEGHTPDGVRRAIVGIPLDGRAADNAGAIRELVSGSDFYASPVPSPNGDFLAWVQWSHPRMPWDGTEVRVAALEDGRTTAPRTVKGGLTESALAPLWADDRTLYVISDWPGWWNIYQVGLYGESPQALYPAEEEFAAPLWESGGMPYALLEDGRLAVLHGEGDRRLSVYDPETLELTELNLPYVDWRPVLAAHGGTIVGVGRHATRPDELVRVDAASGRAEVLHRAPAPVRDAAYLPEPREERLDGPFGRPVHAHVFAPTSPQAEGPSEEKPPYLVFLHEGPAGRASSALSLERAYFTSRGIGVIEVNYGGSSGYGRAFRERLRRQWGVVDVEDAVAAARALIDRGIADPHRLAVRGLGAGGWTALATVTSSDLFRAATSYHGVTDLQAHLSETHDFESRYLFGLIGPMPGFERAYTERSPLTRVDGTASPVLLLHGTDDPVVTAAQSERFATALSGKGLPCTYMTFKGESHGFRRADSIITALESELSFYAQSLGFKPGLPTPTPSPSPAPQPARP
ncbi:prolyl oligopeptidase family serine peptidase [Thermomonospora umbrina]|uniref:Dipeptidyl aminopeptidase/acylaminoacyl peptidase n=1 Tax=Thermomonospora umbrina TaxID=111806 RepID=A0A3D9STH0_9ACTN|nr:prolyl oligopeptidase family serine peptidase [Thermomonospora umbrina]REE99256.1 dipeptidyl aminopeptidase/acylaminoacyl peptidase [Thermomonospora umbrina]